MTDYVFVVYGIVQSGCEPYVDSVWDNKLSADEHKVNMRGFWHVYVEKFAVRGKVEVE